MARISRPTAGGSPDGSGGGGGGGPKTAGASLALCPARYANARRQLARPTARPNPTAGTASRRGWHRRDARARRYALARQSPAASQDRPSHQPRRPDVAVDAALVAEPVGQPGLSEQLVELGPVLLGNLAAHVGDALIDVRDLGAPSRDGDPNRPKERVGQLERRRLGDVEAVQGPVSDQVEIAGHG